jgi:hypothetical protein
MGSLSVTRIAVASYAVAVGGVFGVGCATEPEGTPASGIEAAAARGGIEDWGITCPTSFSRSIIAPNGPWTPVRGATVETGSALIGNAAMCAHGGISAVFPTAPPRCARPLVMSLDLSLAGENGLSFAAGVNGGWTSPLVMYGTQTVDICLGARAFEDRADLFLGMGTNPWLCPARSPGGPTVSIASVSISDDTTGTCPIPGVVTNGDFEKDDPSWTLRPGDTATADVLPGVGEGGSRAAHLATTSPCDNPSVTGQISLPTRSMLRSPALRVWSKGTKNAVASVRIGSLVPRFDPGATHIAGTDEPAIENICIPRWAEGTVQPIQLAFVPMQYAEQCGQASARDFVFDGLSFVSEPACDDADVLDGGFERIGTAPSAAPFWALERYEDMAGSNADLVVDAPRAHSGSVFAQLSADTPCPAASLSGGVTVPSPLGSSGPALRFWYRTSALTQTALSVQMKALASPLSLGATSTWRRVEACLDPAVATRPDLLRFSIVSPTGGTCADTFPTEEIALDDVELTTLESCPAI